MAQAWKMAALTATVIALGLTAADAQQRRGGGERPSFEQIDANGDGSVTLAELMAHRAARFAAQDADGNGSLSRDELLAAAREGAEKRVDRILGHLDANEDGELTQDEMSKGRGGDGSKFFDRADGDGDGSITKAEFEEMGEKRRGRGKKPKDSE